MIRISTLPLLILAIATACGCSGATSYETIPTHPVSGKVVVNGVPAQGAVVRFHPKVPQAGTKYPLLPSGRTDEQGGYQLTTYESQDGAPAGNYVVTIEWPDPNWRPPGGGMPPPPPDRLKGRFADPKRSTVEASVVEGNNEIEPIELDNVQLLKGSSLQ